MSAGHPSSSLPWAPSGYQAPPLCTHSTLNLLCNLSASSALYLLECKCKTKPSGPLKISESDLRVPGSSPAYHSKLPIQLPANAPGRQHKQPQCLGSCHSYGRPRGSSYLPASTRPSSGYWGVKQQVEGLLVSLSHSVFQKVNNF